MVDYNKEMFNSIESNQPHLFKQHVEAGAEGREAAEADNEAQADGRTPPRGEAAPLPAGRGEG